MKKLIYSIAIIAAIGTCIEATIADYKATHTTAEVDVFNGIAVFTDSSPVLPYDILGDVTIGSNWFCGGKYNSKRNEAIKKAQTQYPSMDGILISFKQNGTCSATAIKFKQ